MPVHSAAGLVSSWAAELGVSWCQKLTPEAWHWREGCAFVSLSPPLQGGPLLGAPVPPKQAQGEALPRPTKGEQRRMPGPRPTHLGWSVKGPGLCRTWGPVTGDTRGCSRFLVPGVWGGPARWHFACPVRLVWQLY